MCRGSEAGSYLRLIDLYHSTLGLRVIKNKKKLGLVSGEAGDEKRLGQIYSVSNGSARWQT